jgi:hypothetical protein
MSRLAHAWRGLEAERRLAAAAAFGLFLSMFLPWYSKTDTVVVQGSAKATQTSLNAFGAFSFVEAAVLLVSGGVLLLLFRRAEGVDFRMPGGDGTVVMVAGAWTALLVFYRLLDKPGLQGTQRVTATVGVQWGIFIALLVALGLAYAGRRMRSTERPAPPLTRGSRRRPAPVRREPSRAPTEDTAVREDPLAAPRPQPARRRSAPVAAAGDRASYPPAPPEQLSFEDPPPRGD